jgi:hypothetical protein
MKPISALPHGVLDYAVGILLLVSPWLFGFDTVMAATYTMVFMGVVVLALSIITNYPLGLIKAVPFPTHGKLESVGAVLLLVSPWIMHFSSIDVPRNLAIIVAIAWLGVVALTNYSVYEPQRPVH